ncbi:S1 family peptidase [Streptomyces cinnamoneus]|uniref:S1 family peptidase n=1 Tax=Streptomyces cinnamoneus TaxID=53446 RepID=UPI00342EE64B
MFGRQSRAAWTAGLLATFVGAGVLGGAPASAVAGDQAKDGAYSFTAKLDIGGKRSCSAALVEQDWLITAASCFADNPAKSLKVAAGAPKLKTTATVGRTDLAGTGGVVANVVELVPRDDRDVVMARLDKPVTGVTPVALGSTAPAQGEQLRVAGYGRTKTEWFPNRLHTAPFTVGAVKATSLDLAGATADAAVCKGDTGGPAFRETNGRIELAAVNSQSWQTGCLGANPAETRKGAVDTRVDDIAGWMQAVFSRDLLKGVDWKNAEYLASGYFTGGSAGGTRRMDLLVRWADGSVTLYQGADHKDPKYPFSAVHKLADAGSTFKYVRAITAGRFAADGTDGLIVRWVDGEVTQYTHVDAKGFHDEKMLAKPKNGVWENAKLITAGRYTGNDLRDDLLVVWANGSVSIYSDLGANGVGKEKQIQKANTTWPHAEQIGSGDFTGKGTNDLMVRWSDGEATIYPGVDTAGFHGEIMVRKPKEAWSNAQLITVGAFAANVVPNDVLVRWSNGNVSMYTGVDKAGTHAEVQLVG